MTVTGNPGRNLQETWQNRKKKVDFDREIRYNICILSKLDKDLRDDITRN